MKIQRNSGEIVFRNLRQILDTVSIHSRKMLILGHPFGRLLGKEILDTWRRKNSKKFPKNLKLRQ